MKHLLPLLEASLRLRFSCGDGIEFRAERRGDEFRPFDRDGSGLAKPLHHLGIYGYRRAFLLKFVKWKPTPLEQAEKLEQLRALEMGARIRVVMTKDRSIGVDTPEDLAAAEREFRR